MSTMTTTPAPMVRSRQRRPPTFAQSTTLVAGREITMRLRSKAFLISTGILMLAVLASVIFGGIFSGVNSNPKVAAVGTAQDTVAQISGLDATNADSVSAAEELVRSGKVDAAVLPDDAPSAPLGVRLIALDSPPTDVIGLLSAHPKVTLLEQASANKLLAYFVSLGFGLVFFMSAITFGTAIAQSVVEEKQTRVVEILMATVPVRALMAGKVLGNSILAFGQIAAITVLAGLGMIVTGQQSLLSSLSMPMLWFVVFFVFGFVLIAALYAATAAMVSRQEDVGSATSPVMTLVMLPYLLVILFHDNALILGIMSYVPFSAPVGMPMRIFLGTAQWWEPPVSLIILLLCTAAFVSIGSRIYSNTLLKMGARVSYREALRG